MILQIDSGGAYGSQAQELARDVREARVPVVTWVGPPGAQAQGASLFLFYSAGLTAMAPGAGLGPARPFDLAVRADHEQPAEVRANALALTALAAGAGASPGGVARLVAGQELAAQPALDAGAVSLVAADIPSLLRDLDGKTVRVRREAPSRWRH